MRITTLAFVCSVFAACSWGEGSPGGDDTSADASTSNTPVCGDSVCAASEVGVCSQDCGASTNMCGNGTCNANETPTTCPADCQTSGPVCGDGTCDSAGGETSTSCPGDCTGGGTCPADPNACLFCAIIGQMCPPGLDMASCAACIMPPATMCVGGVPNGVCDAGETMTTCPPDCP